MCLPEISNNFLLRVAQGDLSTTYEYNFFNQEQQQQYSSSPNVYLNAIEVSCAFGHSNLLREFLNDSPQAKSYVNRNAEKLANLSAAAGSKEAIECIIENSISFRPGYYQLSLAIKNDHSETANWLLSLTSVRDTAAQEFNICLIEAVKKGDVAMVSKLIEIPSVIKFYKSTWARYLGGPAQALSIAHKSGFYEIAYILASVKWSDGIESYNIEAPTLYDFSEDYLSTIKKGEQIVTARQELELIHRFAITRSGGIPGSLYELYKVNGDTAKKYNSGAEFSVPLIIEFLLGKNPQNRRAKGFEHKFNALAGLKSEMRFHHLSRQAALQLLAFAPSYELARKIHQAHIAQESAHGENDTGIRNVYRKRLTM